MEVVRAWHLQVTVDRLLLRLDYGTARCDFRGLASLRCCSEQTWRENNPKSLVSKGRDFQKILPRPKKHSTIVPSM
jgi:hypothetical protein